MERNLPKANRAQEKRQQECRSLPWRLGLAHLLSGGLHLLAIALVGWQPGIPEEVEIISFQWVEVEAEPPPESDSIAPISARASGTSHQRDPYLSARQSQVDSPGNLDFEVKEGSLSSDLLSEASAPGGQTPWQEQVQPSLLSPTATPKLPRTPREFESALKMAVADQDWAEALQLTQRWLDTLSPSSQHRELLQQYQQQLHSLISTPVKVVEPATIPAVAPQPVTKVTFTPEPASQAHPPTPQALLPSPAQDAVAPTEFRESSGPLLPIQESVFQPQNQGAPNSKAQETGPPSLDAAAEPDWGTYLAQLQEKVRQHWIVQRATGSYLTVVQIRLDREGSLRELRLQTPSEDPLLDAAVLSAIRRSAPFPPLPKIYTGE
ncbi:MAG: TonB family protein, partial [Thermostichus sp. DG02_4_bins_136]